jgi:hypothetical protein
LGAFGSDGLLVIHCGGLILLEIEYSQWDSEGIGKAAIGV